MTVELPCTPGSATLPDIPYGTYLIFNEDDYMLPGYAGDLRIKALEVHPAKASGWLTVVGAKLEWHCGLGAVITVYVRSGAVDGAIARGGEMFRKLHQGSPRPGVAGSRPRG